MYRSRSILTATALAAVVVLAVPTSATASPEPSDPVVTGLAGPLQIDIGSSGQIYVGQSFAGLLTKVRRNGTTRDLVAEPGSVTGVASDGYDVAYTFTGGTESRPVALLKRRFANGTVRTVANLYRYEKRNNPDAGSVYGFRNLSDECSAQVPPQIGGEPYPGIIESNPYAVANAPDGGWYVADAAANAILHVWPRGRVEVLNVPRPQKFVVTEEAAEATGLPECTVGEVYAFEPVPTDVEVSPLGYVMATLLPGGPEDESLGARGAVLRISPGDFEWSVIGRGFLGATNLAVAPGGRIYVAELFGNRISLLRRHVITPVADLPSPAALEYVDGTLYASTDVFGSGSIVTLTP